MQDHDNGGAAFPECPICGAPVLSPRQMSISTASGEMHPCALAYAAARALADMDASDRDWLQGLAEALGVPDALTQLEGAASGPAPLTEGDAAAFEGAMVDVTTLDDLSLA